MNSSYNKLNKQKRKGKKIILFILLILIILLIGIGSSYLFLKPTPKKVFETSLETLFKATEYIPEKEIKTSYGSISLDVNIETKDKNTPEQAIYDILNKLFIQINYSADMEAKRMTLELDSLYNKNELLHATMYTKDGYDYIYLDRIYDKFIQVPFEDYEDFFTTSDEEYYNSRNVVLEEIKNAIYSSLKEEYFTYENISLNIEGNEIKVTKNIFDLNKENYKAFVKDIATLLNNDNFINNFATFADKDKDVIRNNLKKFIESNKNIPENLSISIYTKGFKQELVGLEIKNSKNILNILIKDKNNISYTYQNEDNEKIDGAISTVVDNENYYIRIELNNEEISTTLNIDFNKKYNTDYKDIDTTNAVYYEDITEDELTIMMMNFTTKEAMIEFEQDVEAASDLILNLFYKAYIDYKNDYNTAVIG